MKIGKCYTSEPSFDMVGKARYYFKESEGFISEGLANRCLSYALKRLDTVGLKRVVIDWDVVVENYNNYLCVSFDNGKGATISVSGIMTNKGGWPFIDHGLSLSD